MLGKLIDRHPHHLTNPLSHSHTLRSKVSGLEAIALQPASKLNVLQILRLAFYLCAFFCVCAGLMRACVSECSCFLTLLPPLGAPRVSARQVRNWGRDPAPWVGRRVLYPWHGEREREAKQEVGEFHVPLGGLSRCHDAVSRCHGNSDRLGLNADREPHRPDLSMNPQRL